MNDRKRKMYGPFKNQRREEILQEYLKKAMMDKRWKYIHIRSCPEKNKDILRKGSELSMKLYLLAKISEKLDPEEGHNVTRNFWGIIHSLKKNKNYLKLIMRAIHVTAPNEEEIDAIEHAFATFEKRIKHLKMYFIPANLSLTPVKELEEEGYDLDLMILAEELTNPDASSEEIVENICNDVMRIVKSNAYKERIRNYNKKKEEEEKKSRDEKAAARKAALKEKARQKDDILAERLMRKSETFHDYMEGGAYCNEISGLSRDDIRAFQMKHKGRYVLFQTRRETDVKFVGCSKITKRGSFYVANDLTKACIFNSLEEAKAYADKYAIPGDIAYLAMFLDDLSLISV